MRERKPVIGVTCNFDYRDAVGMVSGMGITGQDWDFVSGDYVYILEKAGAIPVLIPQYGDLEAAKPFLEQLDGVLISGGHDVGPERYGAFPKGYCGTIMPMRDEQDIAISRYFMMEKKKPILGICRGIQEKTYGNREIRVNSFHHQAIKDAGENVRITAWSKDRVPEAMELEDHPFAVAVQWHPEMMYDSSEQMKLLQAFVKAAEKGTEA